MTVIRNKRDRLLRDGGPRFVNPASARLMLLAERSSFYVDGNGNPTPEFIDFIPALFGLSGVVNFSAVGGSVTRVGESNSARLYFENMTEEVTTVTATLTVNGQTFEDKASVNKIYASTGVDIDVITQDLLNQITFDHLVADLRERIALIDAGVEMVGSVTARIKAETDARVAQLDAAMTAAAAARDAFVKGYTYSKVESDQAEALQTFNITTAFTTYVDGQTGLVLSNAQAYVRGYSYSKTDSDTALSAMAQTLRTEFTAASGGAVTQAWVENYAYSKSQVDSSEAAQFSTLTANYRSYANSARDDAITAASANVANYTYSKAQSDSALASLASTLRSEFTSIEGGVSAAYVQNYTYSKAETNSAISSATQTLVSTVGDHTAAIQTQINTTNGLSAQMTVKIDNNGYVTGYGLASSYVNGIPTSAFIINADRFAVVLPGAAPQVMFGVGQVNGQTVIGFNGTLVGPNGTLGDLHVLGGIHGGDYTGYGWVSGRRADNSWKRGFYVGEQGALWGNPDSGQHFQIEASGNIWSPTLTSVDGKLRIFGDVEINGALIVNPRITSPVYSPFSVSAGGNWSASGRFGNVNFGSRTATIVGADNLQSIRWTIDYDARFGTFDISNENTQTVSLTFEGPAPGWSGSLTVTAIGKDGRIATDTVTADAYVMNN